MKKIESTSESRFTTIRAEFAKSAMKGILSGNTLNELAGLSRHNQQRTGIQCIAIMSVELADELIKELNK